MTAGDWALLGGVFLGGAFPWLEAVIVIPAGILGGLPVLPAVLAALAGNLLTVWLAAVYGQRARDWWARRRARREGNRAAGQEPLTGDEAGVADESREAVRRRDRRRERIDRVMNRWGMPGLAVLGPIVLGTQVAALAAVAVGVSARAAFLWISAGTVAWGVAAAALTVTGASFLGIGA
ncbi:small multi-drug export protein [Ornithinimicrobium sufpigmenti]|uniref:small multi-drug export protein n=1 Tax=Ornithinimicrobium sufpigmenti TaxID=2508882 RepID=UPI001036AD86|nr:MULTISPECIES: small multi-drug export protein [unclassified Ornithinimicrobium]